MIFHYLKIAFRNLLKYRQQTIVSVVGLAVGFVCFALSAYWVRYEMSFDHFHRNASRIYQVRKLDKSVPFGIYYNTPPPLVPELEKHFAGLKATYAGNLVCHFKPGRDSDRIDVLEVDGNFSDLFDLEIIRGKSIDLSDPLGVLVTEEFARSYFKTDNPVGQILPYYIMYEDTPYRQYTVKGVVKSWPRNTNLRFEVIVPLEPEKQIRWDHPGSVYILPDERADIDELHAKLGTLNVKTGVDVLSYIAVPITEAYYTEPVYNDAALKFDQVLLFAILGLMVVVCALFNYLNLYASRIRMRGKELALRKVNGASDRSIFILLITEFFLLLAMSLLLGFVGIEWAMPTFQKFADIQSDRLSIFSELFLYMGALIAVSLFMAIGVVAYLRRKLFQQAVRTADSHQKLFSHIGLITQMIISLGFIFCTTIYFKQIYTLAHHNKNIAQDNIVTLRLMDEKEIFATNLQAQEVNVLMDQLRGEPSIEQLIPLGDGAILPRFQYSSMIAKIAEDTPNEEAIPYNSFTVSSEYIKFYGLELIAGRDFNADTDDSFRSGNVIINETAARLLGFGKDAVGKQFYVTPKPFHRLSDGSVVENTPRLNTVIGLVRDFVFESPLQSMAPVIMDCSGYLFCTIALKSRAGQYEAMQEAVKRVVSEKIPGRKPSFFNMLEEYERSYKAESSLRFLLAMLSLVCVVISLFGIYAMVSLNSEHRRKEVAVRKVNGATLLSLFVLFSREYLYLLLISALISLPIGYFIMKRWCEKFVIQTTISWWVFLLVFVVTALLIFATVVWRVWKTAHMNPSQELKKE